METDDETASPDWGQGWLLFDLQKFCSKHLNNQIGYFLIKPNKVTYLGNTSMPGPISLKRPNALWYSWVYPVYPMLM